MDKPVRSGLTYEELVAIHTKIMHDGEKPRPYACEYPQELSSKAFAENLDYHNLGYRELDWLVLEGKLAWEYAWEHYDELVARECVHRLYGPYCYWMGAGMPGHLTSKRARELKKQTRRKDYRIYELDSNYKLIRVISVRDYTKIELIYHCFECDGTQYGVPFRGESKELFKFHAHVIRYRDGLPVYHGMVEHEHIFADFYEYISDEKVKLIEYHYGRHLMTTEYGYPVDWDSPFCGLTSPVQIVTCEQDVRYTDFSKFFE